MENQYLHLIIEPICVLTLMSILCKLYSYWQNLAADFFLKLQGSKFIGCLWLAVAVTAFPQGYNEERPGFNFIKPFFVPEGAEK